MLEKANFDQQTDWLTELSSFVRLHSALVIDSEAHKKILIYFTSFEAWKSFPWLGTLKRTILEDSEFLSSHRSSLLYYMCDVQLCTPQFRSDNFLRTMSTSWHLSWHDKATDDIKASFPVAKLEMQVLWRFLSRLHWLCHECLEKWTMQGFFSVMSVKVACSIISVVNLKCFEKMPRFLVKSRKFWKNYFNSLLITLY